MKKIFIGVALIVVVGIAYYAISPLFNNIKVDDALPENTVGESDVTVSDVASGVEELSEAEKAAMQKQMDEVNAEEPKSVDEDMPDRSTPVISEAVEVTGTRGHPASGMVRILPKAGGGSIVRFEDFETINGPNLHVYLAKDLDAEEFIDLGPIRGTEGNINYSIPASVNLSEFKYVMHWCVPFGVLFNYAEIN